MAELSFSCSVSQGFNFQKDEQEIVGHIVSLKIGDKELKADLHVTDPENFSESANVVGVLSNIYWNGGYADPIEFSCQVSNENKVTIATLTHKDLSNTEVVFKFTVWDYDPKEKKYYKCFHSGDAELNGLVEKSGGDLSLNIDMDQSMEIVSPKNFTLSMGVMPQEKKMDIHVATSLSAKFVKQWGVDVS